MEDQRQRRRERGAKEAPVLDRAFETQLAEFGLTLEELKGKRIFVLGPGENLNFERGAADAGAEFVYAMSFDFRRHKNLEKILRQYPMIKLITGLFQAPPPMEADLVVSGNAFPRYGYDFDETRGGEGGAPILTPEHFERVLDAAANGGKVCLTPVSSEEREVLAEAVARRANEFALDEVTQEHPSLAVIRRIGVEERE